MASSVFDTSRQSTTTMWFLNELELYKTVKPYRLDFDPENDDFPRTNLDRIEVPGVPVHDVRKNQSQLSFPQCGFSVLQMPLSLTSLDYGNETTVQEKYYPFLERAIQQFSAKFKDGPQVLAIDHKVRKRHATFPISNGENYSDPQPVLVAHVDWTPRTIARKLELKLGKEKADSIFRGSFQYLHAWRPIVGPLRDFPLALCDASSVDPAKDFEPSDDVYENHGVEENYLVYHRPGHKWYYLSDQQPTEILLFRQFDSRIGIRSGVAHCAIHNPVKSEEVIPRQSIEVELLVYWT